MPSHRGPRAKHHMVQEWCTSYHQGQGTEVPNPRWWTASFRPHFEITPWGWLHMHGFKHRWHSNISNNVNKNLQRLAEQNLYVREHHSIVYHLLFFSYNKNVFTKLAWCSHTISELKPFTPPPSPPPNPLSREKATLMKITEVSRTLLTYNAGIYV